MNDQYASAKDEHKHHTYASNVIPWYVRLAWLCFWAFVMYYSITYFLPAVEREFLSPP